MAERAAKRFWKEVALRETDGGWEVLLDGRVLKTPSKLALVIPAKAIVDVVAQEWDAQEGNIQPLTMPFTRAANSAVEKVAVQRDAVIDMLAEYGDTDLLLYRAAHPEGLAQRQAEAWDPVLQWAEARYGVSRALGHGVMYIDQDAGAVAKLGGELTKADDFTLTGLHDLVTISGSLTLALAVWEGELSAEKAWSLSRLDEQWQQEQWGRDDEAEAMAEAKRQDFLSAARFVEAAGR